MAVNSETVATLQVRHFKYFSTVGVCQPYHNQPPQATTVVCNRTMNADFPEKNYMHVGWGPVVQWSVQRFQSERLRVRSRRSATFTPSAHVRRQSLPVWPPTLNNYLYLYLYLNAFFLRRRKVRVHSSIQTTVSFVNSLLSGSFLSNFRIRKTLGSIPGGAALCFFVWSGCQFFYLCRCWKRREFESIIVTRRRQTARGHTVLWFKL